MNKYFAKVREYLLELGFSITNENEAEGIFVVEKETALISNMVVDIEEPILVLEMVLFPVKTDNPLMYKNLLQKNRDIIHGAFVLDAEGKNILFRDTLQIENLDLNELEGSFNSLTLLLSEYANEIIAFSK